MPDSTEINQCEGCKARDRINASLAERVDELEAELKAEKERKIEHDYAR